MARRLPSASPGANHPTRERGDALEDEARSVGLRGVGMTVLDGNGHRVGATSHAEHVDLTAADRTVAQLWQVSRELSDQLDQVPVARAS